MLLSHACGCEAWNVVVCLCYGVVGSVSVLQEVRVGLFDMSESFAEEAVGPAEPGAGEVGGVVYVDAFVDQAGAGGGVSEEAESVELFVGVGGGEDLHDARHGPSVAGANVGTSDAGEVGACVEPLGGLGGKNKLACALVGWIGCIQVREVGERE